MEQLVRVVPSTPERERGRANSRSPLHPSPTLGERGWG
jgi:hypothetical protein